MITPQISIILPTFNSEQYLKDCLSSVQRQTYANFEVVIVNDASTDDSLNIIRTFLESDKRFKLINLRKNVGVSEARNIALKHVSGDYVIFLDSDDILLEEYLNKMLTIALAEQATIAVSNYWLLFDSGELSKPSVFTEDLKQTDSVDFIKTIFSLKTNLHVVKGGYLCGKMDSKWHGSGQKSKI